MTGCASGAALETFFLDFFASPSEGESGCSVAAEEEEVEDEEEEEEEGCCAVDAALARGEAKADEGDETARGDFGVGLAMGAGAG